MKIELGKKYRTMDGRSVDLLAIRPELHQRIIGIVDNAIEQWHEDGFYFDDEESCYDLIEVTPYADFKVDDKVLVSNFNVNKWYRRHFKNVVDSHKVECFVDGQTQWSSKGISTPWDKCVKWEDRTSDMVLSDD